MSEYRPTEYWERLLSGQYDLSGVAYPNLPVRFNQAFYAQLRRAVEGMIQSHQVEIRHKDVLEIGPGTGFWVQLWTNMGASSVTGLDITRTAVERLSVKFPSHEFRVADVGSDELDELGPFDVIAAMSVLLHIVDDERLGVALSNMARTLRPGGVILLMEPLVVRKWWGPVVDSMSNSKARTVDEWRRSLQKVGLELVDQRPATALLGNVCDTTHKLTWRVHDLYWWSLGPFFQRVPRVTRPATGVIAWMDRVLVSAGWGPSAKVMLVRQAAPSSA